MFQKHGKKKEFLLTAQDIRPLVESRMGCIATDPNNSAVFALNTIANYDPDILPLLDSPAGTAFFRDPETGEFLLDAEWMEKQFE